jgi:hypothetical protein
MNTFRASSRHTSEQMTRTSKRSNQTKRGYLYDSADGGCGGHLLLLLACHDERVVALDIVGVPLRNLVPNQLLPHELRRRALSRRVGRVPEDGRPRLRGARCRRRRAHLSGSWMVAVMVGNLELFRR